MARDETPRLIEPRQGKPSNCQVAPRPEDRPPAPRDVWDWQAYATWRAPMWDLLSDVADAPVRQAFRDDPPTYVVGDDLSWLDRIIHKVQGRDVDSKSLLAERILGRFDAVRAYHGTRALDVDPFYGGGLVPLDPAVAHDRIRSIFLNGDFPELDASAVEKAIADVGHGLRAGRVFFEANENLLIEQCGHYMLYGSEYLVAIAAHLPRHRDYRQVFKRHGVPTVFVCDVPLSLISGHTVHEFAGMALSMLFQELLEGEDYEGDPWGGAGFCIRKPLPPDRIVGHYHPQRVRDPLR